MKGSELGCFELTDGELGKLETKLLKLEGRAAKDRPPDLTAWPTQQRFSNFSQKIAEDQIKY